MIWTGNHLACGKFHWIVHVCMVKPLGSGKGRTFLGSLHNCLLWIWLISTRIIQKVSSD